MKLNSLPRMTANQNLTNSSGSSDLRSCVVEMMNEKKKGTNGIMFCGPNSIKLLSTVFNG